MNRYFYYFTIVNMFTNVIASVPRILLSARMGGAIFSMLLSIITGLVFTFFFVRFFNAFPGKGLPELLKEYMPKWFSLPFLIILSLIWFAAGLITLITYSFILKRFLAPELPLNWILACFFICISFGILMKSINVLYAVEVIFLCGIPFIIFFFFKAYSSPQLEWDFIQLAFMHTNHLPSYSAYSASLYLFLGSANLVIFNRVFIKKQLITWKDLLIIGLVGTCVLFTTYFIPIGLNGFEHIDQLIYPWITSSDSLHMKFGIIERVIYLFLMVYLAITFLSILIIWHGGIELLKSVIWFKNFRWKERNLTPYLFILIYLFISAKLVTYLTEYQLHTYTSYFFKQLPAFFFILLILFWLIKRRAKKCA